MIWMLPALAAPNDVISFVLVDRYADGQPDAPGTTDRDDPQAWHGGDLRGVIDHLDDLRGGLWLSPVFAARTEGVNGWGAFHGYWTADPYKVEPRFGSSDDLAELAERLRDEDRELWLDLVLNHVGYDTPMVTAHPDWFHHNGDVEDWNDPVQVTSFDVHGLPDLDQDNPEVYGWLRDAALHWMRTVKPTGFRIDAVRHLPPGFLKKLGDDLRAEDPAIQLLGEVFEGDPAALAARIETDGLDRAFDFPLHYAMKDAICRDRPGRLAEVLSQDAVYRDPSALVTFLDNHDVPRILSVCDDDLDAMARALGLLFVLRGTPSLTWGTDAALAGAEEPENRADMQFEDRPLRGLVDDLRAFRAAHPALGRDAATLVLDVSEHHVVLGRSGTQAAAITVTSDHSHYFDPVALGTDCEHWVLTGRDGWKPGSPDVPAHAIGLALCEGGTEIDLAARFAGVRDAVEVPIPAEHRVVGAGVLGAWDPAFGIDPVGGVATVEATVGDVLTFKEVRRDGDGWSWPDGDNRMLLVKPPRRAHHHLLYIEDPAERPDRATLEEEWDIIWLDLEGTLDAPPPDAVWEALGAFVTRADGRVLEQEVSVHGRTVQMVLQPERKRLLVRMGPAWNEQLIPAETGFWDELGATTMGQWNEERRRTVATGVALLNDSERALLQGSRWRYAELFLARWEGAWTSWRKQPPHLELVFTPGALEGDRWGHARIGEPAQPHDLGMQTLVHQLGHVVQGAGWIQATNEHPRRWRRCRWRAVEATLAAYQAVAVGDVSPSEVGEDELDEAWAEAFSFWLLHPAYLKRTAPAVYEWFEHGNHLHTARSALERCTDDR